MGVLGHDSYEGDLCLKVSGGEMSVIAGKGPMIIVCLGATLGS